MRRSNPIPIGTIFGKWTILKEWSKSPAKKTQWLCVCTCGAFSIVLDTHLRRGKTKGCKSCAMTTHGLSSTAAWKSWQAMLYRCTNKNHPAYHLYSNREICSRWKSFENFFDDMGERPEGKTLDRINNDEGYSKDNCRWATAKTQSNNMSSNRIVFYEGKNYTCSQLADHLGISYCALYHRIKKGQRLDLPVRIRKKNQK